MDKIECGYRHVGDRCLIMPNRMRAEVTNIHCEEMQADSVVCKENVRLKLKNVEGQKISPGFVLCDAEQEPCEVIRVFDAQINHSTHVDAAPVKVQLKELVISICPSGVCGKV